MLALWLIFCPWWKIAWKICSWCQLGYKIISYRIVAIIWCVIELSLMTWMMVQELQRIRKIIDSLVTRCMKNVKLEKYKWPLSRRVTYICKSNEKKSHTWPYPWKIENHEIFPWKSSTILWQKRLIDPVNNHNQLLPNYLPMVLAR